MKKIHKRSVNLREPPHDFFSRAGCLLAHIKITPISIPVFFASSLPSQTFVTRRPLFFRARVQVRLDNRVLKVVENRVVSALSKELLIETLQVSPGGLSKI